MHVRCMLLTSVGQWGGRDGLGLLLASSDIIAMSVAMVNHDINGRHSTLVFELEVSIEVFQGTDTSQTAI